jgi:hypothetical protein
MHLFADSGLTSMSEREGWQEKVLEVFQGEFSVPHDRHKLVEPCIGLWILTRQRLEAVRVHGTTSRLAPIVELMHARRAEVFPSAFFGNLIAVSEALVQSSAQSGRPSSRARLPAAFGKPQDSRRSAAAAGSGAGSAAAEAPGAPPRVVVEISDWRRSSLAESRASAGADGPVGGSARQSRLNRSYESVTSLLEARAELQMAMQVVRTSHAAADRASQGAPTRGRRRSLLDALGSSARAFLARADPADSTEPAALWRRARSKPRVGGGDGDDGDESPSNRSVEDNEAAAPLVWARRQSLASSEHMRSFMSQLHVRRPSDGRAYGRGERGLLRRCAAVPRRPGAHARRRGAARVARRLERGSRRRGCGGRADSSDGSRADERRRARLVARAIRRQRAFVRDRVQGRGARDGAARQQDPVAHRELALETHATKLTDPATAC